MLLGIMRLAALALVIFVSHARPYDGACLSCHKSVWQAASASAHAGFDCASCHADHGPSPTKSPTKIAFRRQCLECHDKTKEKEFVHEPAKSDCSLCHNPHAGSPKHLRAEANAVCLECHSAANVAKLEADGPLKLFAGQVTLPPRPFENLRLVELKNDRGHPVSNHPINGPAGAAMPVKGCMTCHDPHAANNSLVFLVTETPISAPLCQRCHQ